MENNFEFSEKPKVEVGNNYFYLVVSPSGYFLKTSKKEDYEELSTWNNIFAGVVKNSNYLHFRVGRKWLKKRISHLPISRDSDETLWYDTHELDLGHGSFIQEVKITEVKKAQTPETL